MTASRPVVLGAGGWGTAVAQMLARAGHSVGLWTRHESFARELQSTRRNSRYLDGVDLHPGIEVSHRIGELVQGASPLFSVIPTQHLRATLEGLRPDLGDGHLWVSCSKGIERGSLRMPSGIIEEVTGAGNTVILTGPSHAEEVARDLPTTVVAAAAEAADAASVQSLFESTTLRVYTGSDPVGAEVGGAIKNVIAIATGISAGLGFGDNSQAAIITRGLVETTRLGLAMGARRETFSGLSGMGDLITTCTSQHSRNRTVGHRIGSGETLQQILETTATVAEGVETSRSLHHLREQLGVDMPIAREVFAVLHEGKSARDAVSSLMSRTTKSETEDLI